jgi:membrane fusion protein (multidrug efflux system)
MVKMMRNQKLIIGLSCCLLPFLQACGTGEAGIPSTDVPATALSVEMTQPVTGSVSARHLATTTLEADAEALVSARASGEIRQIHVEEGQYVHAGDLLVTLDGERLRLDSLKTQANLAKLEQDYRRQIELNEKGLVAATNFEDLKFSMESQRAAHELAQLQYSYTRITAPISGVVSERMVKVGQTLTEGDAVLRITDTDSLMARIQVPQSELGKFAVGQPASLRFDALPGLDQEATVSRISPTVDPGTGTFRVQLAIRNPRKDIAAGMFSRVQIAYERKDDVLLLPETAVIREDTDSVVYVVEDGQARRRLIQTGISDAGMTEILSGLKLGETVIVSPGSGSLREGTRVAAMGTDPIEAG